MRISRRYSLTPLSLWVIAYAMGCGSVVGLSPPTDRSDSQQSCGDAVLPPPSVALPGASYVYVISALELDETANDENSVQYGFNLDGIHTASDGSTALSCGKPDQPSALDPEENCLASQSSASGRCSRVGAMGCRAGAGCVGGVDNQLPNILDAFGTTLPMRFPDGMRPVMKAEVRWGRHPLLLVVSGVESFENDPEVELSIYDAVPTFSRDCGSAIPDREYAIVAESVVAADVQRSIYGKFQGSISAGRLRSRGLGFPLYWPADTLGLPPRSVLQNARINMDLRDSGGRRGNVGGYVSGDSVIESLVAGFSGRLVRTQIEGILGGFVDIQCPVPTASTMMSGTCVNRMVTPTRFGNIGMGFGISVVRARLAPMLATGRPPEVCDGTVGDAQVQDVVDASSIADVPRVPDAGPMIDAFVPTDASELDSGG